MGRLKVLLMLANVVFMLTACIVPTGIYVVYVNPEVYNANDEKVNRCLITLYTYSKYSKGEYRLSDERSFDSGDLLGLRTSPYKEKYYFVVNCKSHPYEYTTQILEKDTIAS